MKKILFIKGQLEAEWEEMWVDALREEGFDVHLRSIFEKRTFCLRWINNISSWIWNLPVSIGEKLNLYYKQKLDTVIFEELKNNNFDYFITYNGFNELSPSTLKILRRSVEKMFLIVGDNIIYAPGRKYNIDSFLNFFDIILTPDRGMLNSYNFYNDLKTIYIPAGTDKRMFYKINPTSNQIKEYGCDLLFVGKALAGNQLWGDHRAKILNSVSDFDLKIFGDRRWEKHFQKYPNLRSKVVFKRLSTDELNIAHNCAKIYVAITNATVIDGVITRVFDALASGLFVLYEHRDDCHRLFPNDLVPTFKSIKELREKIKYYLKNEKERKEKAEQAREIVLQKYLVKYNVEKLRIFLK